MNVNELQVVKYPNQPPTPNDETRWVKWFHHRVEDMPPKGDTWEWGYIHVRPAVAIVAVNEDRNVVLVRQFRYPLQRELVEVPKGFVNDNEEPLEAAKRELREEVGFVASQWEDLGEIIAAPGIGKIVHFSFLAQDLWEAVHNKGPLASDDPQEPEEQLQVKWVSLDNFFERVEKGVIIDAVSIAAVTKAKAKLRL